MPERIGRYRIERLLGQGGFGLIYLAHDDQLARAVAIKVPHARLVTCPEDAERYLTEARMVANLDHPNIVSVYDVGCTDDFPVYVVCKYVEGISLATKLQQARLSFAHAAELVATVAEALHHAHKQGLVHRDIKPGNILLDCNGKPYVADFGLALREQDVGKGPCFVGTPDYMSPEQAHGEGHRVDCRSDIFSLGVVFYELLVGRRPFRGETVAEVLEQVTDYEPRPPRQCDDTIPKELERICLKALSKRATDRYTTAKDMADDLGHFLNSQQREAAPKDWSSVAHVAAKGNLSQQIGSSDQRAKVVRGTFIFADFKGFTERVRILEKAAGHQAAAEMKRTVAHYVDDAFGQLEGEVNPADYDLIDTAGDGFFFHFRFAKDAFRFAEALQKVTAAHNAQVTDEFAEHWFRTGAATGEAAWDAGKPVGHVVNVGSRLQSASTGGDFVIDRATYDDLPPDLQQQFGPKESIRDKHDKTYDVYRTAFGRALPPLPIPNPSGATTSVFGSTSASVSQTIKIVPKGLRSFDAHDADFFLELLPGPRDRDGLPDSIRFWKSRIEETDADNTFAVGLIYGPSGCGKSSLVKAGLLPCLSNDVISVYVEATAEETETRLLGALRKRCSALPADLGLKDSLTALRRGQGIPAGKKVLIVLDQFEQWLHAKKDEENTELVQALRQCDGSRIQCIVMVRDDFWMAATRFLRELEIRLLEGQNSGAVDLFPVRHAAKVLAAFGCAFGILPDRSADTTKEQKQFLEQAVSGLAEDGKVICVRLALFAEMMKGKPWTPATLKEVGGAKGVGVTFLEETFSVSTAPPDHRYHQKAARAVLKALLPDSGSDIKGHMRSSTELLAVSGYAGRPQDFGYLIRILDGEIRLITPTDVEGKVGLEDSTAQLEPGERYYQLTHDYLVHSLREWLTRKQRETRKGQAELRLAERSELWIVKPENRHLPSAWEFLNIRLLTDRKNWTGPQRKMMGQAGRVHGIRSGIVAAVLVVAGLIGMSIRHAVIEKDNSTHAEGLVEALVKADITEVPSIVFELEKYRTWADPLLRTHFDQATDGSKQRLNMALALLPVDRTRVEYLYPRLLAAAPNEFPVLRNALIPYKDSLVEKLWAVAEQSAQGREQQRLRAACALAAFEPEGTGWAKLAGPTAEVLVTESPLHVGVWIEALRPVAKKLLPPLEQVFQDVKRRESERSVATSILADYAAQSTTVLAELIGSADPKQFATLLPKLQSHGARAVAALEADLAKEVPQDLSDDDKEKLGKWKANAAAALLRMDRPEKVWPLLQHCPDPRARSYLVHCIAPLGGDPKAIIRRVSEEKDVSVRRALLLSLGEFDEKTLPAAERQALILELLSMYCLDLDSGIHGAAEWLLRQWGQEKQLRQTDQQLATGKMQADRQWYVTPQGRTMVIIRGPVEFVMGSPGSEIGRDEDEVQHRSRIGRSFALADKTVTVEDYQAFLQENPNIVRLEDSARRKYAPTSNCPMIGVLWYNAAAYCNWLSKKEGIAADQWCYEANASGQYAEGMKATPDMLVRTGYRLPTEAEWEFACRAGAVTSRFYGETRELLAKYAWHQENSKQHTWPVGSLKANDLGLFDMQGNVYQWCQDVFADYRVPPRGGVVEDVLSTGSASDKINRVLRGGSFDSQHTDVRSAYRVWRPLRFNTFGFRVARTYH